MAKIIYNSSLDVESFGFTDSLYELLTAGLTFDDKSSESIESILGIFKHLLPKEKKQLLNKIKYLKSFEVALPPLYFENVVHIANFSPTIIRSGKDLLDAYLLQISDVFNLISHEDNKIIGVKSAYAFGLLSHELAVFKPNHDFPYYYRVGILTETYINEETPLDFFSEYFFPVKNIYNYLKDASYKKGMISSQVLEAVVNTQKNNVFMSIQGKEAVCANIIHNHNPLLYFSNACPCCMTDYTLQQIIQATSAAPQEILVSFTEVEHDVSETEHIYQRLSMISICSSFSKSILDFIKDERIFYDPDCMRNYNKLSLSKIPKVLWKAQ